MHNRFLVMESSPPISDLHRTAAFLSILRRSSRSGGPETTGVAISASRRHSPPSPTANLPRSAAARQTRQRRDSDCGRFGVLPRCGPADTSMYRRSVCPPHLHGLSSVATSCSNLCACNAFQPSSGALLKSRLCMRWRSPQRNKHADFAGQNRSNVQVQIDTLAHAGVASPANQIARFP